MPTEEEDITGRRQDIGRGSKKKYTTPPKNYTEIGSAEIVVSGSDAHVNVNKASPQDFIEIFEYAQKQKRGQAVNEKKSDLEKLQNNLEVTSEYLRASTFISYSRADARYLEELHNHLAPYVRAGKINFWDDTKILPGAHWSSEIDEALRSAKVAVFLVSAKFLASDFIARRELPPLLHAAEHEGVVIMSVILCPCAFELYPLSAFQAVNEPSDPLCDMNVGRRNKVWLRLAERIGNILKL